MLCISTLILSEARLLNKLSSSPTESLSMVVRTSGSMVRVAYVPALAPLYIEPGFMQMQPSMFLAKSIRSLGVIRMSGVCSNISALYCSHSIGAPAPAG